MKYKKGFTLIELVISLAIFLILLSIAYPFFLSNYASYMQSEANLDMQNEGEKAIESITNIAMQSKQITSIIDVNGNQSKNNMDLTSIKSITFKLYDDSFIIFELDGNILKKTREGNTSEVGRYIDFIKVKSITGQNVTFENANGITLIIGLKKGKYTREFTTDIYFRNSQE